MIVSTKGRYALRVMIDLAEHQADKYVPLKEVATRQEISEKYLENILKVLVQNGFLEGLRGKGGGYRLTRSPEQYTVEEILNLTEGISQLTGALDTDQLHALQTVLDAMVQRMQDYDGFAGTPEGAVSTVKFLYKTAEDVEPAASVVAKAAPVESGNFFVRLWKKLIALFQF